MLNPSLAFSQIKDRIKRILSNLARLVGRQIARIADRSDFLLDLVLNFFKGILEISKNGEMFDQLVLLYVTHEALNG